VAIWGTTPPWEITTFPITNCKHNRSRLARELRHTEQLVQLLIVSDSQLQMPWNDTLLLVITGSIASQLEDLRGQVLQNGSEVDYACNQVSQ